MDSGTDETAEILDNSVDMIEDSDPMRRRAWRRSLAEQTANNLDTLRKALLLLAALTVFLCWVSEDVPSEIRASIAAGTIVSAAITAGFLSFMHHVLHLLVGISQSADVGISQRSVTELRGSQEH